MKMNMCRLMMVVLILCVGSVGWAQWPTIDLPETDPIGPISRYPESYLDWMDGQRRSAGSAGLVVIYPEAVKRAQYYRDMYEQEGADALAKAMVDAYTTDDATMELAAGAIAISAKTGHMAYGWGINIGNTVKDFKMPKERQKELGKKVDIDHEALLKNVTELIDAIEKVDSPYVKDVAAEMMLQVFAETLMSGHAESHNGRREIYPQPKELTARAASMLGADDPFVHAIAEWAVSVNVCNENNGKGEGKVWPGQTPPEWWDKWAGIDPADHLELDYIRQAITLQMHRHGKDLLTLSNDQMRRAEAKAAWGRGQLPADKAAELDAKVKAMREAHAEFAKAVEQNPDDLTACRKAFLKWRPTVRPVAMSGPDMDFDSLVYVERVSGGSHGQPGTHYVSRQGLGGDIYVQNGLEPDSENRAVIADKMPERFIQDMDLWYDAGKVVFSASPDKRTQNIYEIDIEGKELTQLTDSHHQDVDTAYLPDGGVVFGSTRAEQGVMCASGNNSQSNIFRLSADRSEVMRLTYCKDDDAYPYVLNDGRIVWMRWDYQERGVDEIFSLWAIRPDGTGSDGLYRVHIPKGVIVQSLRDPKPIPGSDLLIATGGSHRCHNEGMLIVADTTQGINNPLGIRTVTPYNTPTTYGVGDLMRSVQEGGVPYPGGLVTKPHPLSDKTFLASMCYDMPESNNFWLYYVDVWGNKELIHRNMLLETVCAFPLKEREMPVNLPNMADPSKNYATCYVENMYADLPKVEKGEVKYIQILKNIGWPLGVTYHPNANPAESFGFPGTGGAIQVIGTVPVEEDGSAYFDVPAASDLYFMALDKDFRAVQRMRTHVEFGRGERRSCLGCHETRDDVSLTNKMTTALKKQPVRPTPPPWGDTTLMSFEKHIQPIFEAKCVKCHGEKEPKADLELTARKDNQGLMQSFRSIHGLKYGVEAPNVFKNRFPTGKRAPTEHPWWEIMADYVVVRKSLKEDDAIPNIPKRYGAVAHPLATKLTGEGKHAEMLTDQEKWTLMTWFDIQSPYFDKYQMWKGGTTVKPYEPFGDSREYIIGED